MTYKVLACKEHNYPQNMATNKKAFQCEIETKHQ